ncbi:hypothetical protein EQG49_00140 [Periweissella cryptocerci]|uniref:Right-handed parallel beta-helix repeat-containing protein n=1 Tax=Periweissella cryptocerci TaxID=2506420 RepID=A0A4P6YQV0_9LACO|nr:hypothetical protein [Periweissella cryptocerci]QBO34963.1 hypothetical protein EQG49_00140 [Periweissella cryptocerci]
MNKVLKNVGVMIATVGIVNELLFSIGLGIGRADVLQDTYTEGEDTLVVTKDGGAELKSYLDENEIDAIIGNAKYLRAATVNELNGGDSATLNKAFAAVSANGKVNLQGTFKIGTEVKLPAASGVTIDASGATFTGSGYFYSVKQAKNLTWKNGTFATKGATSGSHSFRLFKVDGLTLDNLTINFHAANTHFVDLMGCKNINIKNCDFNGYGATKDRGKLRDTDDEKKNPTHKYKGLYNESIDVDYASDEGAGGFGEKHVAKGDFDDTPTTNIDVRRNRWVPRSDSYAQFPIGQHYKVTGKKISGIKFNYNYVYNPVPTGGLSIGSDMSNSLLAPVHFPKIWDSTFAGNYFRYNYADYKVDKSIAISTWVKKTHTEKVDMTKIRVYENKSSDGAKGGGIGFFNKSGSTMHVSIVGNNFGSYNKDSGVTYDGGAIPDGFDSAQMIKE